ncbi:hypothetical protein P0E20_005403 [Vibrio harveyi]|nr:hypothetical protein [Vibrio harveyi]
MEKIFELDLSDKRKPKFELYREISPSDYDIYEKDIENWFAENLNVLFTDADSVFILSQESKGEKQADILGIDSQGNLIIIELKRGLADRTTVGQVLDYASTLSAWEYENFNARYKSYKNNGTELIDEYRKFVDSQDFSKDELCKKQRLFIVAPHFEEEISRIVHWLSSYDLPIDVAPFTLYLKGDELLLKVNQINVEPLSFGCKWGGDWFFNTNETYSRGAYKNMLEHSCIAIYGYSNPEEMLSAPNDGDRVFFYRNGVGIIAIGEFESTIEPSNSIFGKKDEGEYIRKVKNIVEVTNGISASEVRGLGYNLPVRSTLCKIYNDKVADLIVRRAKA